MVNLYSTLKVILGSYSPDTYFQQVLVHLEPPSRHHLQVFLCAEPVWGVASRDDHLVERHWNVHDEGDDEGQGNPDGGYVMAVQVPVLSRVAHGHEAVDAQPHHDVNTGGDEGVPYRHLTKDSRGQVS